MKLLIIILVLFLTGVQTAEANGVCTLDYLILAHQSIHTTYDGYDDGGVYKKFNETNNGLGVECRIKRNEWYWVGTYTDSFGGDAAYIGKMKAYYQPSYYLSFGMLYGAVISKEYNHRLGYGELTPLPLALPAIRLQYKGIGVNITYKPRAGEQQSAVFGLLLKIKL